MKIKTVVLDTGAFITGFNLWEYGEELYTVDEVITELRDKKAKQCLLTFPVELKRLQPQPQFVKQINEISKKTGDYASLSVIDVKVLALTLQLEVEAKGNTEHLNFNIERPQTIINGNNSGQNPIGFYYEKSNESKENEVKDEDQNIGNEGSTPEQELNIDALRIEDLSEENANDEEELEVSENECDEGSSDEEGWITPSTLAKNKNKDKSLVSDSDEMAIEDIQVACITSDFAMQNVLKHIKLHVMGVDGKIIQQLRTYILRCFACRSTTSVMSKIFCPKCGNKTLKRVAVTVNPDGSQKIWISTRRPINTKGMRFSLPTPKGGKHAAYPHLTEDQRFPHQRGTKKGNKKVNPLDPDYDGGNLPFSTRDIYSRAGQLGLVGGKQQGLHYWERRNPNVPLKSKGNKK